MAHRNGLHTMLRNNGLALVMGGLFVVFLAGLCITGYYQLNEELTTHSQPAVSFGQYLLSGEFGEAVFENWESEFLQMWALVMLTIWLRQKGSADSKKLRGREPVDTTSRYSIIRAHSWAGRRRAFARMLYANSLGLALLALFAASFVLHVFTGTAAYNQEAVQHGEQTVSALSFALTAQFWFESFQNWQSEFLAVVSLLLLSVFLRQRGSPESKPIGESNKATGE